MREKTGGLTGPFCWILTSLRRKDGGMKDGMAIAGGGHDVPVNGSSNKRQFYDGVVSVYDDILAEQV